MVQACEAHSSDPTRAEQRGSIGDIFRAALLSNVNLGGDNVNRGMLLGALLGGIIGAHSIPMDLLTGLHRYEELQSSITAFVQLLRAQAAHAKAVAAESGAELIPHFGRPWPLPLYDYVHTYGSRRSSQADGDAAVPVHAVKGTPIQPPVDLPSKLGFITADASRAGVEPSQLWYDRTVGPLLLWTVAVPGHPATTQVTAIQQGWREPKAGAGIGPVRVAMGGWLRVQRLAPRALRPVDHASVAALDAGDAAADRAEVMRQLSGSSAATATASQAATSAEDTAFSAAVERAAAWVSEGSWARLTVAEDTESLAHARHRRAPVVTSQPGTGLFYYPHSQDTASEVVSVLATRLQLLSSTDNAPVRASNGSAEQMDPVSERLAGQYGLTAPQVRIDMQATVNLVQPGAAAGVNSQPGVGTSAVGSPVKLAGLSLVETPKSCA